MISKAAHALLLWQPIVLAADNDHRPRSLALYPECAAIQSLTERRYCCQQVV